VSPLLEPQTARLQLRQWRDADKAPFAALNADPEVMKFFPSTLDRAASDAAAERYRAQIAAHGWGFWAVERKDGGEFIGFVGLNPVPPELPFSAAEPRVEIGWRLARAHWGRGYATEAARAALAVGFEQLGLEEIVSFTAESNHRSRAVMERLGMREDVQTFEHPRVAEDSPLRRHCLYRICRDRFSEN